MVTVNVKPSRGSSGSSQRKRNPSYFLTPSQNLAIQQGRDPQLTPGQRNAITVVGGGRLSNAEKTAAAGVQKKLAADNVREAAAQAAARQQEANRKNTLKQRIAAGKFRREQQRQKNKEDFTKALTATRKTSGFKLLIGLGERETRKPYSVMGYTTTRAKEEASKGSLTKAVRKTRERLGTIGPDTTPVIDFFEQGIAQTTPETKGEVFLTAGAAGAFVALPTVAQGLASPFIAGPAVKTLDNPNIPTRLKGGAAIQAVAGTAPLVQFYPFAKGKFAAATGAKTPINQVTPKEVTTTKPITPKLFGATREAITGIETTRGTIDIGIIPRGRGFSFSQEAQRQFLGKPAVLTSAQRGFLSESTPGVTFTGRGTARVITQPGPEGMGIFFTQTPLETGGAVRTSRLGLAEPLKMAKLSDPLGLPISSKPEIFFSPKEIVKNIGYKGTSELETTFTPNTEFSTISRGSAVIEGQPVQLIEITGVVKKGTNKGPTFNENLRTSQTRSLQTPGSITTSLTQPIRSSPSIKTTTPTSFSPSSKVDFSPNIYTTSGVSSGRKSTRTPKIYTGEPTRQPTKTTKPLRTTTFIRPPRTPKIPVTRKLYAPTTSKNSFRLPKPIKAPSRNLGSYSVQLRRFGKFKTIGVGRTALEAYAIGRSAAANTLGATFRVTGAARLPTPRGFKRSKKLPNTFIELPKYRLSKQSEISEIKLFNQRKRKKKKR